MDPNTNDPATVPPATVGPPSAVPGDAHGVAILGDPGAAAPPPPIMVAPWSGWPAEWSTPAWFSQYSNLVDTAWMCLDLNASILSTMPPYTVRNGQISEQPSWMLNPDPDIYTSWEEFAKQLFWDYQLGEVFIIVTARYSDGWPARFHVIEPWLVNVEMNLGRRSYTIGSRNVDNDILHIRYQSTSIDAHGHGPLEAGRARMIAAGVLAQYATKLASSGGVPYYVLKHPETLEKPQADALREQWWQSRIDNLGMPAIVSGGLEIEILQVNPKDMALLELSQFNESRIANLLGVPPFLAGLPSGGDSMTYSNVTSLFDYHWRAGLRPKAAAVMSAMSGWALPRGTGCELNRDEYVRPGLPERAAAYATLHGIVDSTGQVITAAEIRALERFDGAQVAESLTGGRFN
jgi:HK97 family phage portal protein